nr:hypothetical protein CFP56_23816 [Quercus suber]
MDAGQRWTGSTSGKLHVATYVIPEDDRQSGDRRLVWTDRGKESEARRPLAADEEDHHHRRRRRRRRHHHHCPADGCVQPGKREHVAQGWTVAASCPPLEPVAVTHAGSRPGQDLTAADVVHLHVRG